MNRLNQPVIAKRRLRWDSWRASFGTKVWCLYSEDERRLYYIQRAPGKKVGRRGAFVITTAQTEKELGRKRTLREAKDLVHKHFAEKHNGAFEGHWTSFGLTYELSLKLKELVQKAPKTDRYPRWVPKVCPFCGSKRVEIKNPPRTMGFNHQKMTCLHCGESVYKHVSFARSDAERAYCGLTGSPVRR